MRLHSWPVLVPSRKILKDSHFSQNLPQISRHSTLSPHHGFTFSTKPSHKGFNMGKIAETFNTFNVDTGISGIRCARRRLGILSSSCESFWDKDGLTIVEVSVLMYKWILDGL